MNGHQTRRETTAYMLNQILHNRHASLTQWAMNNAACWQQFKNAAPKDSHDWHVAEVEIAYWEAILGMLKGRAS